MKITRYRNTFFAFIALAIPQIASATLLVGWHDFDSTTDSEGADFKISNQIPGSVNKDGSPSVGVGGSNDGLYGPSTPSTGINDGYLRIDASTLAFSLTNNTVEEITLTSLLFDAAIQGGTGDVFVNYQISSGASGSLGSVSNATSSGTFGASADYGDYLIGLASVPLIAVGQTISFLFTGDPNARIDNIGITGIAAIPEPSSLLALGLFLGSGLMLRSRRIAAIA